MPPRKSGISRRELGKNPIRGYGDIAQRAADRVRANRTAVEPPPPPDFEPSQTKDPTNTMFPDRPRSDRATYDPATQQLNIEWARPGQLGPSTTYKNVTPQEWAQVNGTPSTGRYVNRVLNYKEYFYP